MRINVTSVPMHRSDAYPHAPPTWRTSGPWRACAIVVLVPAIVLLLSACNVMVPPGHENDPIPRVELTGSGPVPVEVDSIGGECGGAPDSFFYHLELDVGLGVGFSAREDSPGSFTLTLTTAAAPLSPSGATGPIFSASGITAGVSENYPVITFNTDLVGETGTEHITGRVECPGPDPTSPPPAPV